jgi:hypothetical protein
MLPGRVAVQRVAGDVEAHVFGQFDRQLVLSGTGTTPQASQWMTGIGSPSNAGARRPSRAGARRSCPCPSLRLGAGDDGGLGGLHVHAVEEIRVDERARPGIGLVADRSSSSAPSGDHDAMTAAYICARNRGRAGRARGSRRPRRCHIPSARNWRPDRQLAGMNGWITESRPVSKPSFSGVSISAAAVPVLRHSAMKAASSGSPLASELGERMIGGDRGEAGAEQRVGPGGEDLQIFLYHPLQRLGQREGELQAPTCRSSSPASAHLVRPAVERIQPIEQFVGESVILRNHCSACASRPARPSASPCRRSPARWPARSCRPDPS